MCSSDGTPHIHWLASCTDMQSSVGPGTGCHAGTKSSKYFPASYDLCDENLSFDQWVNCFSTSSELR